MSVNPQDAKTRPYMPGEALGPGETAMPGPGGTLVIVSRNYSAPPAINQPVSPVSTITPPAKSQEAPQPDKTAADVASGNVAIFLQDGTRKTLADMPPFMQEAFREAYKEGGLEKAFNSLGKSSAEYNAFVNRWNESVAAAQVKYKRDVAEAAKSVGTLHEWEYKVLPTLTDEERKAYYQGRTTGNYSSYETMIKDKYVGIGDNYILKKDWQQLDKKYQDIAKDKGYDAMVTAMKEGQNTKQTITTTESPTVTENKNDAINRILAGAQVKLPTLPIVSGKITSAQKYDIPKSNFVEWLKSMGVSGTALAAVGVAVADPIPGDEAIIVLAVLGAFGITKAIQYFKGLRNRGQTVADVQIAAVNNDNQAVFVDPEDLLTGIREKGYLPTIPPVWPQSGEQLIPPRFITNMGEQLIPPKIQMGIPVFKGEQAKTLVMITPAYQRKALSNILWSAAVTEQTRIDLGIAIQEAGKYLPAKQSEAVTSLVAAGDYDKVFRTLNNVSHHRGGTEPGGKIAEMQQEIARANRAHQEYLAKLRLYLAAKQQFINSTDPQPIKGQGLGMEASEALAGLALRRAFDKKVISNKSSLDGAIENDDVISTIIDKALEKYIKTYKEALRQGRTASQAKTEAMTGLKQMIQTQIKQATKTITKTATKTQTKTQVKQAIREATQEATQTAEMTRPMTRTMTREMAREMTMEQTQVKLPKSQDEKKRQIISESGGMAVAYLRGTPHGKGMWHVWVRPHPDAELERLILYGRPPEGARIESGAHSAYRSIQQLFGRSAARRVIKEDTGAVDTTIELGGKQPKISFERDVRLTPPFKKLTPSTPRISPKPPRITPKSRRIS
jgi:hypothetical protein